MMELWPFTNFHDLNLDWIVKTIKTYTKKVDDFIEDMTDAWDAFKNVINHEIAEMHRKFAIYVNVTEEALNTGAIADGAVTEPKIESALLNRILNGYVTPEMFGAIGDGVQDDTDSLQDAIDYCGSINGALYLTAGKTYKTTDTLHIANRMALEGNGATIDSDAQLAIYIHNSDMWDGEFNTINNLYLVCTDGIKIECIRTQLTNSMIRNKGTALEVVQGAYESIISNCYLVSLTGGVNAIGIKCRTSDIIFDKITGYGQKTFIINYGSSSTFSNIHGWPIDNQYQDSTFFYEDSHAFAAQLVNCYSDTYMYAVRSTHSMNHEKASIHNMTCSWSNKPEGWLFYGDSTDDSAWAFMIADVNMTTMPTIFHLCNIPGVIALTKYTFKIKPSEVVPATNCYVDGADIIITGNMLTATLYGAVDTSQRTSLEINIPYLARWSLPEKVPIAIGDTTYIGSLVRIGGNQGTLKIECTSGFPANSGYKYYRMQFTRCVSDVTPYTN